MQMQTFLNGGFMEVMASVSEGVAGEATWPS